MSEPTNITYYDISIPDLNENPYSIVPQVLNNNTYYFQYTWNNRDNKAYLSIYILNNNEKIFLMRNKSLVVFLDLSKYIISDNNYWSGNLYFDAINFSETNNYSQEDISLKYKLRYIPV